MIPAVIHQTARVKELTWEERRLANRLRRMLPGWSYNLYDDADNLRLMAENFPQYVDAYQAIRFGVARADIARVLYLHLWGGFYFDTDYKLVRPFDDDLLTAKCVIPLEHVRDEPKYPDVSDEVVELGNCIMGSVPAYPLWAERITDPAEIIPATGPESLTWFYLERKADYPEVVLPAKNLFHPDIKTLGMFTSAGKRTYGIHFHWGSWRGKPPLIAARTLLRRKINAF